MTGLPSHYISTQLFKHSPFHFGLQSYKTTDIYSKLYDVYRFFLFPLSTCLPCCGCRLTIYWITKNETSWPYDSFLMHLSGRFRSPECMIHFQGDRSMGFSIFWVVFPLQITLILLRACRVHSVYPTWEKDILESRQKSRLYLRSISCVNISVESSTRDRFTNLG